jgi:hypothetical protein
MATSEGQMAAVWRELRKRYTLLDRAVVKSFGEEETFPPFFGLFLAALDDKEGTPCCFVLPRCGQMARLAATVFGLCLFRREFDILAHEYAKQKFAEGTKVRVFPSEHVFVFGGFWPDQPDKFRLWTLDGTGSRTFPSNDVLRLELTNRVTPRGRLDTRLSAPEKTVLDEILGIPTFGNLSLFKNRVLCLDEQIRFREFAEQYELLTEGLKTEPNLEELLPFGWLRDRVEGGAPVFENWSTRYPHAEPLVALTSSSERLAAFCCAAPKRTKVVVSNGLRALSNLQAFDDIAASQRLVLFSDYDHEDLMRQLEARGCRFWVFGENEFFSGDVAAQNSENRRGSFGTILHRARNLVRLQIRPEPCESEPLNAIALGLEELRIEVDGEARTNPDGRLGRYAKRLWRMLNEMAGLCHEPSRAERDRLEEELFNLRAELDSSPFWFKPDTVAKLRTVLGTFGPLLESGSQLGNTKGDAVIRAIEMAKSSSEFEMAVLTRTERQARSIEHWLSSIGLQLSVFSLATLPDDASFDRLVITSWLGSEAFRRLITKLITADIVAASYGFEARWLAQCQKWLLQKPELTPVTAEEKAFLVAPGETGIVWPEPGSEQITVSPSTESAASFDVWNYEQRLKSIRKNSPTDPNIDGTVRSKYLSFVGSSYALLTQWHKVPVATHLLGPNALVQKSLPEQVIDDLRIGDVVVFPEGGEKAIIAQIADRLIGANAPKLRQRSRIWREALRTSGMSPEQFLALAKTLGFSRHIGTIRNWFFDETQIGPGEREDLDVITAVTGHDELYKHCNDCWDAISFLRSSHLSAGSKLRDAILQQLRDALPAIEENGSRIEIPNLGAAWIVEVDAIAPDFAEEASNQVNRLLWDEGRGSW